MKYLLLFKLRGFRAQTAFVFGALSVALSVALAVMAGGLLSSQVREEAGSALHVVAQNAARTLAAGLYERSLEVSVLASSPSLWRDGLDSPQVRETLARSQATQPYSAWIGVIEADGTVRAATGGLLEGISVAKRPWFQEGLKGSHVGDLHVAQLLAALLPPLPNGEPNRFVDFAAPILVDDKVVGVYGVHGSWEWAQAVVESLVPADAADMHLEVFIFDRSGTLIYASPGSMTADQMTAQRLPQPRPDGRRAGPSVVTKWVDGKDYLTSVAPVVARTSVSDLGWTVVAREPTSTAFAAARASARNALLLGGVAAALAVFLAWFAAGLLSDPLEAMARAARDVERGVPGATIPLHNGSREVERLSRALAGMTRRLLSANEVLERRVRERTAELESANQALEKLARHDPLTGLMNRRAFEERMGLALAASKRSGSPLSVLMLDADHFKSINDRFGHDVGDEVLKTIAVVLMGRVRETDTVARMGGEEFAVLLPDTDDRGAKLVGEDIVQRMADTIVPLAGRVTLSAGVATLLRPPASAHSLMVAADRALYDAKGAGRNCVRASRLSLVTERLQAA